MWIKEKISEKKEEVTGKEKITKKQENERQLTKVPQSVIFIFLLNTMLPVGPLKIPPPFPGALSPPPIVAQLVAKK